MIRYSLVCANAHAFEGWFRSSEDFENQAGKGLLVCPHCGSPEIAKALMAPRVISGRARAAAEEAQPQPPSGMGPAVALAPPPPEAREMIARLKALKAKLLEGSEDVGARFAEEARRIHFGEAPKRSVHGEASAEDARELVEEGIDILALPILPGERN